MRDILCKANRIDNGEFVEGYLLKDDVTGQYFIHAKGNSVNESDKTHEEGCLRFVAYEVDENTICQYTGKTDKCKKMIYEHDIVKQFADCDELGNDLYFFYEILWNEQYARFEGHEIYNSDTVLFDELDEIEVVGSQLN